jgi:phosphatidylglycerophosphatase GEP4
MVQSINTKALLTLASVVRRPSLLVPHVSVENISQLDFLSMKANCGIRAVAFDKDNTLTAPYDNALHPSASEGLANAISVFGSSNVAILSNSAGTLDDQNYTDAIHIEETLGIPVIRHREKKPGGLDEVLKHFDLKDPAELCVVGDRLLTDIVFGNLHGMLTAHTLPLCTGKENAKDNKVAKLIRSVENTALYSDWCGSRMLWRRQPSHKKWSPTDGCFLKFSQN